MHAFALWTLIIWISVFSQSVQQPPARQSNFVNRALDAFMMVSGRLKIPKCVKDAQTKAGKEVGDAKTDNFYAIAWISMYSRLCIIGKRQFNQDRELRNFPFRLNKELRCSFYRRGRDRRIREIFLQAGNIINEALTVLRPVYYRRALFRGVKDFYYRNQSEFVEEGFFSVSTDINIALRFAEGNVLLIVERVRGVYIAEYAQDRFRYQKEVLAKRNSVFKISRRVENKDLIKEQIRNFGSRILRRYPREIIYLSQVNRNRYVTQRLFREQQSQSFQHCTKS